MEIKINIWLLGILFYIFASVTTYYSAQRPPVRLLNVIVLILVLWTAINAILLGLYYFLGIPQEWVTNSGILWIVSAVGCLMAMLMRIVDL